GGGGGGTGRNGRLGRYLAAWAAATSSTLAMVRGLSRIESQHDVWCSWKVAAVLAYSGSPAAQTFKEVIELLLVMVLQSAMPIGLSVLGGRAGPPRGWRRAPPRAARCMPAHPVRSVGELVVHERNNDTIKRLLGRPRKMKALSSPSFGSNTPMCDNLSK